MQIAFIYDAVYPWEKGGAQKRVWELARRLASSHDVHIYGMHYWDGPSDIEREGVTLHGVCAPYELYHDGRRSIPQAIKFAANLSPPLMKGEFDVIDCQQFPFFPSFVGWAHELARQSALVITWYEVWDDYWYEYLGWKGLFGRLVERATVRLPETIVPISSHIERQLQAIGRTGGLQVVENGVDYGGIQDVPAVEEPWDIVYVGRLAEHKHVDWLLEAVATLVDDLGEVRTCIIGDGPERDRLESYSSELGLQEKVEFKGFVERDEAVIGNIKAADVFVLPSTREGFPNTILEANACGVPSVVVDHDDNGSTAVVLDGDTGIITEPDTESIARAIRTVLTDAETHEKLKEGAREFGKAHDWELIVDRLEQVYVDVIRKDSQE